MSINQSEESLLQKRKADIAKQAAGGSLQAIAITTGVSRQTLYRWKKGGMSISTRSVLNRIASPTLGLNGEKSRGPRLGSGKGYFPGFTRKDRLKAKKSLAVMVADLSEAVAERIAGNGGLEADTLDDVMFAIKGLKLLIPPSVWSKMTD